MAVQHMPARVMPLAPLLLAYSSISGVVGRHHDHLGQQRLMAVHDDVDFVFLQDAQVDLAAAPDTGVPNMTSCRSVAIIEPPQPSARAAREHCLMMFS